MSHQLLCFNEVSEAALHKFWDLESIGISDAPVEDVMFLRSSNNISSM